MLKLAQRMTLSFCRAVGASSINTWTKIASKTGEDVRIASRKNLNDPGEPIGVIITAVSSLWLPLSPNVIFDFLRDDKHRHEVHLYHIRPHVNLKIIDYFFFTDDLHGCSGM